MEKSLRKLAFEWPSERDERYYEHLRLRQYQYYRRYLLGTSPHLTGLAETDKNHEDALMDTLYSEGIAVIVFSVYCKDAYDRKLYLLYYEEESEWRGLEKYFLCYNFYEITKFTTRKSRGRKDREYLL